MNTLKGTSKRVAEHTIAAHLENPPRKDAFDRGIV